MQKETDILEYLIPLVHDSIHGYKEASNLVKKDNIELTKLFRMRADERKNLLVLLRSRLEMLDGQSNALDEEGTLGGDMHQVFMKFKSLFQQDSKAALAEVERGESLLIKAFEEAIQRTNSDFKATLQESLKKIRYNEYTISELHKDNDAA